MNDLEWIRKTYNVPAKRGMRIRFMGNEYGTILSGKHGRLRVRFDGQKIIAALHPTWELEYSPKQKEVKP